MAVKGISFAEFHWYVSRSDTANDAVTVDEAREKGATIFWYGAIPNLIITKISDEQTSSSVKVGLEMSQTFNQRTAQRNRDAFRHGIAKSKGGWENFSDEQDEPIVPEWITIMEGGKTFEVLSEATMDRVPLYLVQEVGARIFNDNSLGEEGRKKFEAQFSHSEGFPTFGAMSAGTASARNGAAKKPQKGRTAKKTSGGQTPSPATTKVGAPDE